MNNSVSDGAFEGFPRTGLQFLKDLEQHNERAWFNERKSVYSLEVEQPLRALVLELARRCARAKLPLAPNPRQPVFRIYRDVRFSSDKRPYKTFAATALYPGGDRTAQGSLYLHVDPHEPFVGAGFHMPPKETLAALRAGIERAPADFAKMRAALQKTGTPLSDKDAVKRLPRQCAASAGAPFEPYLKLTSFFTRRELDATRLRGPVIGDDIMAFLKDAAPLLRWGWRQLS